LSKGVDIFREGRKSSSKSLSYEIRPTTVCTRPATARHFNLGLLAKSVLGEAYFAYPQAGETEALGG
jgi:hypothetical protein